MKINESNQVGGVRGKQSIPAWCACDGAGPHKKDGEIRRLSVGGLGNALLCEYCHDREMVFRREFNASQVDNKRSFKLVITRWLDLPLADI